MTTDAIYEEHRSDWSNQVSVVVTTRWLQRDQTLPLSVKGVACETICLLDHRTDISMQRITRKLKTITQLSTLWVCPIEGMK